MPVRGGFLLPNQRVAAAAPGGCGPPVRPVRMPGQHGYLHRLAREQLAPARRVQHQARFQRPAAGPAHQKIGPIAGRGRLHFVAARLVGDLEGAVEQSPVLVNEMPVQVVRGAGSALLARPDHQTAVIVALEAVAGHGRRGFAVEEVRLAVNLRQPDPLRPQAGLHNLAMHIRGQCIVFKRHHQEGRIPSRGRGHGRVEHIPAIPHRPDQRFLLHPGERFCRALLEEIHPGRARQPHYCAALHPGLHEYLRGLGVHLSRLHDLKFAARLGDGEQRWVRLVHLGHENAPIQVQRGGGQGVVPHHGVEIEGLERADEPIQVVNRGGDGRQQRVYVARVVVVNGWIVLVQAAFQLIQVAVPVGIGVHRVRGDQGLERPIRAVGPQPAFQLLRVR